MENLTTMGQKAKSASKLTAKLSSKEKNVILQKCANALFENAETIITENMKDVGKAKASGVKSSMIDRLILNGKRIKDMAQGLRDLSSLDDPVNEVIGMKTLSNGLIVGQKRVPFGVVGIIYESRPNVTSDAFGICLKSGNCAILRGGKDALLSNIAIVETFKGVLDETGLSDAVQFIDDPSREIANEFMKLRKYVDVLIPRGGASLIQSVVQNSTIPVIETGTGNCHFYVDDTADLDNAIKMIVKAKVERPGVCNACEKVLIHKDLADSFLPVLCGTLRDKGVEIRGDETVIKKLSYAIPAVEDDWHTEYLDYIIGIKVVDGITQAIEHIQKYTSGHSEAILTESYENSQRFLNEIDAAAVYVNASTRFTDGYEFGLGAEIGISTQKLHARGPMGLKELTSTKYIVYGTGQIR